eukprot:3466116-Pyramimonas_sp.AAC.1
MASASPLGPTAPRRTFGFPPPRAAAASSQQQQQQQQQQDDYDLFLCSGDDAEYDAKADGARDEDRYA